MTVIGIATICQLMTRSFPSTADLCRFATFPGDPDSRDVPDLSRSTKICHVHSRLPPRSTMTSPELCTSHTGGIIRAYCYGIEKNGDHVKIRKNRRFTNFWQKWHTYPYVMVLISTYKLIKRVTRCIPQPLNAINP